MASPRQRARFIEGVGYSALGLAGVALTAVLGCFSVQAWVFELQAVEQLVGPLPDSLNLPAGGISSILALIVVYNTKITFDSAAIAYNYSKLRDIRRRRFPLPMP